MDYILNKINEDLDIAMEGSVEKSTLLKERLEYSLVLALGYLYHKNSKRITSEHLREVNDNFINMTFGKLINNIRILDIEHEFYETKKKKYELLNQYTTIRNQFIGHGYIHGDAVSSLEDTFTQYYNDVYSKLEWFNQKKEFILITKKDDNNYHGIRFDEYRKNQWMFNREAMDEQIDLLKKNDVLLFISGRYYKVSPFIVIEKNGNSLYVFSSLQEKRSGRVKLCCLINTEEPKFLTDSLFICNQIENDSYKVSENGSIMNNFDLNYKNYMKTPVEEDLFEYLEKNTSNVQATLWGHGGVGKTAAVQYICERIFHGDINANVQFKYIIFATAKDRKFDPRTGKIVPLNNLKSYNDIIKLIILLVFGDEIDDTPKAIIENEERIANSKEKILIVIDDYETFSDEDKQSIQDFINTLDINYHRVIITTRNKKLTNGIPIPTNEFSEEDTKNFFIKVISSEYPEFENKANEIINNPLYCNSIYLATEGRAISIHHFVNLLVQRGFSEELLRELHNSEDMSKFLYDRIYALLSEEVKKVFCCVSLLVNHDNLLFSIKTLEYITEPLLDATTIDDAIEELVMQKVIEPSSTEAIYRVYTEKLYLEMKSRYSQLDSSVVATIATKTTELGEDLEITSIEDALLRVARKAKISGTHNETKEKYFRIIKNKKYSPTSRKKAINEYLDYEISIDENSKSLRENKQYLYDSSDKDISIKFIKALWSKNDSKGKEEAVDLLMKDVHSAVNEDNYIWTALRISICVPYFLSRYKESTETKHRQVMIQLLDKDGFGLFKFLQNDKNKLQTSADCREALLVIIRSICEAFKDDERRLKSMKYYLELCFSTFKSDEYSKCVELRKEVQRLLRELGPSFLKKYDYETLFNAEVIRVNKSGVKCKISPNYMAYIFDSEAIAILKRGDRIFAKLKHITSYHELEISYEGFADI